MVSTSMINSRHVTSSDRKSRFWHYLCIFFDLMDSVVANSHVIYNKKVNAKMILLDFKVFIDEALINHFTSRKRKFASVKPKLAVELSLSIKESEHLVQLTGKKRHCQYCFDNEKKNVKCYKYCKTWNVSLVCRKRKIVLIFSIPFDNILRQQ